MDQGLIIGEKNTNDTYQIKKFLASGLTSNVYKAIHIETNQTVAIKQLKQSKYAKIILQQIEIMKKIQHPNIIKYYGSFIYLNRLCIVLEYCGKGTLAQYLEKVGKIPQAHAKLFTKCILKALKFLHQEKNIAHRDLKEGNILITDDYVLKIADFGFSKQSDMNMFQTLLGSPSYMAPQILKQQAYEMNVDVWALGVIAYSMLYGQPPFIPNSFDGFTNVQRMRNVLKRSKIKFNYRVQVSPQCLQFISQCLQKESSRRPSSGQLLNHSWMKSDDIGKTYIKIVDILSQSFKDRRHIANKVFKTMFSGVFQEYFSRIIDQMQLNQQIINQNLYTIRNYQQCQELKYCYLQVTKMKLQQLTNTILRFVIEQIDDPFNFKKKKDLDQPKKYTFNIQLNQTNKFKSLHHRITELAHKIPYAHQTKPSRYIAQFVRKQTEISSFFPNESTSSQVIPLLTSLSSLIINQLVDCQVTIKWAGASDDQQLPFMINELHTFKESQIISTINEYPPNNEDLRVVWLIENHLTFKSAKSAQSQVCQTALQVLSISSNFESGRIDIPDLES